MSLTARERRNPPPRRKSCAACIKAKRRCDMAVPACMRCSQRRVNCQYPNRGIQNQNPVRSQPDQMSGLLIGDAVCLSPSTVGQLEGSNEDFNSVAATIDAANIDPSVSNLAPFELPSYDDTLDLLDTLDILQQQPSTLVPPSTRVFDAVPETIANRLQWSIDEIRKAPKNAHACCALYLAKNRVNAPIIFRSIESRVSDLLRSPAPNAPKECLAHTQALLLYQIIRLLDGDIGARVSAERDLIAIETSAIALFAYAQFDLDPAAKELPLFPITPTKTFWIEWALQESIRRTLLLTFYFLQAYRIMTLQKGLQCDGKLGLCHSWTVSSYLWQARTPMEFAEAWTKKRHFVVTNASFTELLQEAMAGDIDSYGKIFITSLMGIDEAEGWFASRGGSL